MAILTTKRLTKQFGGLVAIDNLDLEVKENSIRDSRLLAFIAHALGRLNDQRAVQPLINCLDRNLDTNQQSLKYVIAALGELGDAKAVPHLVAVAEKYKDNPHDNAGCFFESARTG